MKSVHIISTQSTSHDMETLKLSKRLLYTIGLHDRNSTRLPIVLFKYFTVTFFLLVVMGTCFPFAVSNWRDFELSARALLPTFALLISCASYWILIAYKHEIGDILLDFEALVEDSKYSRLLILSRIYFFSSV